METKTEQTVGVSVRKNMHTLLEIFEKHERCFEIKLGTDIDRIPLGRQQKYGLYDDSVPHCFTTQQKELVEKIGNNLIYLSQKKKNVLRFTSKDFVRTCMFAAYIDFLITIRNQGKAHFYQTYEITISIP